VNTPGIFRELLQQIYRRTKTAGRISVCGALHRLPTRAAEILNCLVGVIAVTKVMRQLTLDDRRVGR
jgi:hypothetical protein